MKAFILSYSLHSVHEKTKAETTEEDCLLAHSPTGHARVTFLYTHDHLSRDSAMGWAMIDRDATLGCTTVADSKQLFVDGCKT